MKKILLLVPFILVGLAPHISSAAICTGQLGDPIVCPTGTTPSTYDPTNPTNNAAKPAAQVPNTSGQPCGAACNLGYTPLEPIPGITSGDNGQALNFPTLLGNVYKVAIIIGALFSVVMLTINGVRYMLSEVLTEKSRAVTRIKASMYGLVLIAASWLILNTINPQLLKFNLNPGTGATITPGQSVPITGAPATISCLDTSCLTQQQKADLQAVQTVTQQGAANSTPEQVQAAAQAAPDATNIQAAQIATCNDAANSQFFGGLDASCSNQGTIKAAQGSGYNTCTPVASGGVCFTK